jgi:hypothetical protein
MAMAERDRVAGTAPRRSIAGPGIGLGLGAFVDGIVLHQLLQWHHMIPARTTARWTVAGLEANTLADGFFHAATWVLTAGAPTRVARPLEPPTARRPAPTVNAAAVHPVDDPLAAPTYRLCRATCVADAPHPAGDAPVAGPSPVFARSISWPSGSSVVAEHWKRRWRLDRLDEHE